MSTARPCTPTSTKLADLAGAGRIPEPPKRPGAPSIAQRPPRPPKGRRTWTPVAPSRSSTPSARAQANTSARVRTRRSGRPGTAHPRSTRSACISPTARVTAERSTSSSRAMAERGRSCRGGISVAAGRSTKTSRCLAPAPAARLPAPPRAARRRPSIPACHGPANSATRRARRCREMSRAQPKRENRPTEHDRHSPDHAPHQQRRLIRNHAPARRRRGVCPRRASCSRC